MSSSSVAVGEGGESIMDSSQQLMDQEKVEGCLLSIDDEGYETPGKKDLPPLVVKHSKSAIKESIKKVVK